MDFLALPVYYTLQRRRGEIMVNTNIVMLMKFAVVMTRRGEPPRNASAGKRLRNEKINYIHTEYISMYAADCVY